MLLRTLKLLQPHHALNYSKIRIGDKDKDGGYIMIDDFKDIRVAISGGIGTEDSWEREIISKNIPVEAFDIKPSDFKTSYRFFVTSLNDITLSMVLSGYKQHEAIMKLDIDGDEWSLFENTSVETLNKIRQMAIEIHLNNDPANLIKYYSIFGKLNTLFKVVHIHGNNYGNTFLFDNFILPDIIELTFANHHYYKLLPSHEVFPTELDRPNGKEYPEIQLGTFIF